MSQAELKTCQCYRCKEFKAAHEFRKEKRKSNGLSSYCRSCSNEMRAEHRRANPSRVKEICAASYRRNAEKRKAQAREYRANNPDKVKEGNRRAQQDPERKARHYRKSREWVLANKERVLATRKAWEAKNGERLKTLDKAKFERNKTRPEWMLSRRISAGIWKVAGGKAKSFHWLDFLGYSVDELRSHLERQFTKGMSWENMGEWHIDHIVPVSSFSISGNRDPQLKRAWGLPNLRPLWGKENMSKGAKIVSLL